MIKRFIISILALSVLSSCGNDSERVGPGKMLGMVTKSGLGKQGEVPAGQPTGLTRAALAQIGLPIQLAVVENVSIAAIIAKEATNKDVETWATVDDVTISLREGVLVSTRGLGTDLMVADVPSTKILRSSSEPYQRTHVYLDGSDQRDAVVFSCKVVDRSNQVIEIVEKKYNTIRVVERCGAGAAMFENEYWIQGASTIRKSRQWIGKELGHLRIEDLRD